MTTTKDRPVHAALPAVLTRGYASFAGARLKAEGERFRTLSEEGQKPPTLLIGCCDSRVAPEAIFDAGPGEIFVVRNIAALVPPYDPTSRQETAAAIEYAVIALKVAHIVVMGHAQCGGVRAYAQGAREGFAPLSDADFISKWKALIAPAANRAGTPGDDFDAYCETLCCAAIAQSVENLRTYPFVRERETDGTLSLHGAYFGIKDGVLMALDQTRGTLVPALAD